MIGHIIYRPKDYQASTELWCTDKQISQAFRPALRFAGSLLPCLAAPLDPLRHLLH
jgi:hypothetical protein